jgi:hypothetical protein
MLQKASKKDTTGNQKNKINLGAIPNSLKASAFLP